MADSLSNLAPIAGKQAPVTENFAALGACHHECTKGGVPALVSCDGLFVHRCVQSTTRPATRNRDKVEYENLYPIMFS